MAASTKTPLSTARLNRLIQARDRWPFIPKNIVTGGNLPGLVSDIEAEHGISVKLTTSCVELLILKHVADKPG